MAGRLQKYTPIGGGRVLPNPRVPIPPYRPPYVGGIPHNYPAAYYVNWRHKLSLIEQEVTGLLTDDLAGYTDGTLPLTDA